MSDIRIWKKIIEKGMQTVVENDENTDHEVSMAKSQLLSSVKSSIRIAKHLKDQSEQEGLEGWVASKITLAEEYLQTVADYMDGEELQEGYKVLPPMDKEKYQARDGLEGPFSTLSGKVVYYDPKEGKYYDPDTDMYISYEDFQKLDNDYSDMKEEKIDEGYEGVIIHALKQEGINAFFNKGTLYIEDGADMEQVNDIVDQTVKIAPEIKPENDYYKVMKEAHQIDWPDKDEDGDSEMERHAYNAIRHDMNAYDAYDHVYSMSRERDWLSANKDDIIKMFSQYGLKTESLEESEESEALTEEQFDEAAGEKDACYHKVKSRYKVWPSAYASGALVKCRKVGAKNWGNSKK